MIERDMKAGKVTYEMIDAYLIDKLNTPRGLPTSLTSQESKLASSFVGGNYLVEAFFGVKTHMRQFLAWRLKYLHATSHAILDYCATRLADPANAENHAMIIKNNGDPHWLPFVKHNRKMKAAVRKHAKAGMPEAIRLMEIISAK